jgi:ribose 5-phosphate isomerase B
MKKIIVERDIIELEKQGIKVLVKSKDSIITPLALDRIRSLKIDVVEKETSQNILSKPDIYNSKNKNKISIGSDHTGFRIKNILVKYLNDKGYEVLDAGTYNENSCDYPDYAKKVSLAVVSGESDFGILIDATGIPSAITANKIRGIRAATCYNTFSAKSSRAHNNANVLVVGAKSLGDETINEIVSEWLSAEFEGGRHQKRLDKISIIENERLV